MENNFLHQIDEKLNCILNYIQLIALKLNVTNNTNIFSYKIPPYSNNYITTTNNSIIPNKWNDK